jgi:arylsulfatase A-like enzyme
MNRIVMGLLLFVLGIILPGTVEQLDAAEQKNVLLIWVDQMQHDVAGYAGGAAETPALDKLAAEGVNFRTACTTTALCSPMRAALYTGRWGHRTGLDDNTHVWASNLTELSLDEEGLIEWAREAGYFTGYFGKWHLGSDGPIKRGVHRFPDNGFERGRYYGTRRDPNVNKHYYEPSYTDPEKPNYYATIEGDFSNTNVKKLANYATGFLAEAEKIELPFFLTVSFPEPHPAYKVPVPYNTMYDYKNITLPGNYDDPFTNKPNYQRDILHPPYHDLDHMSRDDWKRANAYYRGMVSMTDRGIGEILDALKTGGFADNTLVVFVSDHGDMIGAHRMFDKGPYMYDEVLRVPMLIRKPGVAPKAVDRHVSTIDVTATILDWMELPMEPAMDSRSLMPLVQQGDKGWGLAHDEVFSRYEKYNGRWYGIRAIRNHEWKYNWNPVDIDELYDLVNDPLELNNLIDDPKYRMERNRLKTHLLKHLQTTDDPLAEEFRNRMRSE